MSFLLHVILLTEAIPVLCSDTLVSEACWEDAGYCIVLMETLKNICFTDAKIRCQDRDMELLSIRSRTVQNQTEVLMAGMTFGQAWIGGRKNEKWRTDSGLVLNTFNISYIVSDHTVSGGQEDCLIATRKGHSVEYSADNCDEKFGNFYVICQVPYSSAECVSISAHPTEFVNGECYVYLYIPIHRGRNSTAPDVDWYSAQEMCLGLTPKPGRLVEKMNDVVHLLNDTKKVWTGYRRYWYWITSLEPMSYYNRFHLGDEGRGDFCLQILQGGGWIAVGCGRQLANHYICMNVTAIETSTVKTSEDGLISITPSTPSTTTTPKLGPSITTSAPSTLPWWVPYAGGGAGGLLLLFVLLVIVVVCLRRKKPKLPYSQEKNETSIVETNGTGLMTVTLKDSAIHQNPTYSPEPAGDSDISPYAEYTRDLNTTPVKRTDSASLHSDRSSMFPPRKEADHASRDMDPVSRDMDPVRTRPPLVTDMYIVVNEPRQPNPELTSPDTGDIKTSGDIYATVDKPKRLLEPEDDEMEDVIVDNTLYGSI